MATLSSSVRDQILERFTHGEPRSVATPGDFLDIATREAVDKALQRLAQAGDLRRIDRGLYDQPALNRLTQRPTPPDPRKVIDAIARRDQIRVLVDGLTAANDLGFTNAVPAKIVVHTDARLKPIRLDNLEIAFHPTAASKLFWAGRPAMRLVQALHWLRNSATPSDEDAKVRSRIRSLLADSTQGDRLRADLTDGMPALPEWMQSLLKPMLQPTDATA